MLSIDISHAASFLPLPYQAALRPRLERAANWLQQGGGKVPCRGSIAALFAGAGVLMREALLFFPYKPTEIEQII